VITLLALLHSLLSVCLRCIFYFKFRHEFDEENDEEFSNSQLLTIDEAMKLVGNTSEAIQPQ
jgi:hypothetical protein